MSQFKHDQNSTSVDKAKESRKGDLPSESSQAEDSEQNNDALDTSQKPKN